jgi:nucleoside-diphosphate-sugar epimerase
MTVLVTGGAGYLGSTVVARLVASGRSVRIVDNVMHEQHAVVDEIRDSGADVILGDLRDPTIIERALVEVESVVHLAAIVGDVACRNDPERSDSINVDASLSLVDMAANRGVCHVIFASTCSNYGVVDDDVGPVDEDHELGPVSRYARQKVQVERELAHAYATGSMTVTCLRFATLFGASRRMRFDLLINEFVRDLWDDREIEIYDPRSWRPYVHVEDAACAVELALARTGGIQTYNVGVNAANFRKQDVADLIARHIGRGAMSIVDTGSDQRSYRVAFDRIAHSLDFTAEWNVERGTDEMIRELQSGAIDNPWSSRFVNA